MAKLRVVWSEKFGRQHGRLVKKHPKHGHKIDAALGLIEENYAHPKLKTHKLKGVDQWASTVSPDCRIIFDFVILDGCEIILLQNIGSHGEVY
jgi:mRNA-degrading endonuclease YafQ of YafQ-DinJ toxin-antitoxin module